MCPCKVSAKFYGMTTGNVKNRIGLGHIFKDFFTVISHISSKCALLLVFSAASLTLTWLFKPLQPTFGTVDSGTTPQLR